MERIKEKLHSQSGASFLLALLAFLVAAVVSVVIVTAAVTNVKRIYSDREAQQDHLTLLSAAQLVRDEMEKTRYIITTTTTTTTTTGENGKEITETVTYNIPETIAVDPPSNGVQDGITYGIKFTLSANNNKVVKSAVLVPVQPQ